MPQILHVYISLETKCATAPFAERELNTLHGTVLASVYLFCPGSWEIPPDLWGHFLYFVTWNIVPASLMWSPLNFTAESLKITQPLTQMWYLVLFLGAHENGLPMLPWGHIQFVSSWPQWSVQTHTLCIQRRHLKSNWRRQQYLLVYSRVYIVVDVVRLFTVPWGLCLPSIISPASLASVCSTSGMGTSLYYDMLYFTPLESITLC